MIKDFTPRLYQQTVFATATKYNTLVVLPTGMGKTNIFLLLAAQRLKQYPNSKILFIGPTRPLIDQYKQVFIKHFEIEEDKLAIFTGYVKPEKREDEMHWWINGVRHREDGPAIIWDGDRWWYWHGKFIMMTKGDITDDQIKEFKHLRSQS